MKSKNTSTLTLLLMAALLLCAPTATAQSRDAKYSGASTALNGKGGKSKRPSNLSQIDVKQRTVNDLLYLPYGAMPIDPENEEEAIGLLKTFFGDFERVNGIYVGLHANESYAYTYRDVPIGLVYVDWFNNRTWYEFYFDTKPLAQSFYNSLVSDLRNAGIPMNVDKVYGGMSSRGKKSAQFKNVYVFAPAFVKEADTSNIHRSDVVGKYYVEFGIYKK